MVQTIFEGALEMAEGPSCLERALASGKLKEEAEANKLPAMHLC